MRTLKASLLLLAVAAAILAASVAWAQSSFSYDLGCWGTLASSGGLRQSSTYRLQDSIGQATGGQSQSSNFVVRGGYQQNWTLLKPTPMPEVTVTPTGDNQVFMPIVNRNDRIPRPCLW